MENLYSLFPCRQIQIDKIHQLLGEELEPLPDVIFISGHPAVGKTNVTLECLKHCKINYAYINCVECYSYRLLHEQILMQLTENKSKLKCDTFMELIHHLKLVVTKISEKFIIVLDGAEYLEELNANYFSAFCRLQEFVNSINICVICISSLLPEKFNLHTSLITIHFPQYSKDELLKILKLTKPEDCSNSFYENYLNSALMIFLRMTRDLNEMKFLVSSNFEKYCEPVKKGLANQDDVTLLWRNILPHFKESLKTIYSGLSTQSIERYLYDPNINEVICTKVSSVLDLPYYAKYFLISAYLASYNAPKHDRRLFMKNHGKQRKRLTKKQVKEKMTLELLGPKAFPLDRLLAIFYAIMEEKASLTVNLMTQISTLVELKLLARVGESNLERPKFKCLVGLQCVDAVARTLGLNIQKYLLD
ncbi:origin recognition complex subunit 5 [Halyomorpha halys]|uniref:origin recognition complex subunit 5 n=1 Tax=Halyomorpha halys TaxID=286706 RepID=UPI0006D51260|nr:origin recognition complex subunit 5 [Halyomorpha halys]XP_014284488.1 origin recognition complex subunit 5 [Halyomorpha halys]